MLSEGQTKTKGTLGTFYEVRPAEETLDVYLNSLQTLYDRVKNQQIAYLLDTAVAGYRRVLEIGCGGGVWTKHFVSNDAAVTVVEKESHLIDAARLYLRRSDLPLSQVDFRCADIVDVMLEEKFDLVFAKDVLEHIREDEKFVQRLASALAPGGLLFISTQNSCSLNYCIEGIYQRYIRGHKEWMGWDPTHVRFYNYSTLKRLLGEQRLQPIKWVGMYHIPYRLSKIFGSRVLSTVELTIGRWFHIPELIAGDRFPLNLLGWNIIVLAKKSVP